jgi:cobalt transport protein ATP-binding subunit
MTHVALTPASSKEEVIRLEQLRFTYAGQTHPALDAASLSVRRGEMIVVMGATGAGKTTLAKCLNRTIPAFQSGVLTGTIALGGRALTTEGVAELAGIVGLVSQDFEAQLFATNVQQEVAFGMEQVGVPRDEMRRRLPWALATVGLDGFAQRDPATLSGGEKQRLAIAATLALQPQILVFDEPTTDLDPAGKLEIFAVLATMRREGYTLVVIEHEISAAEKADRVVILSHGRIVADDRPEQVLTQVAFLEAHGVRAPDICRLGVRLGLDPVPVTCDAAAAAIASAPRPGPHTPLPGVAASTAAPLVSAVNVEFRYEAGPPALAGVSLTVRTGEFLALVGQNGSGKTTLAKMLNGLLQPTSGRVLLEGQDIRSLSLNQVAGDVGYVFQNPDHQLFAGSVADEVAFGPRNFGLPPSEVGQRVAAALAAVELTGYEDDDPFLLSKGHRQRLAVASLLALQPRLLILDEPTTGLDYREQRRMMDLLAELHRRGLTVVMITHSPWVIAEYAERAVLMSQGRVIFDGPLRELFADERLLEQSHFRAPDITRLGRRLGLTPLSVDELAMALGRPGGGYAHTRPSER